MQAWEATPADPPDRVEAARRLLSLNRVGAEVVADEKGSDLLTLVSITALATGSSVLRAVSPKLLVAPVVIVRYVALLAWGMVKTATGGPAGRTLAGLAFGVGSAIVAVRIFTDASLGVLTVIGFALFVAGALLAYARAPFILVPVLALMAIPNGLSLLPAQAWTWWPSGWIFPTLNGQGEAIPRLAFILGAILIGLIRRPGWLGRLLDDERRINQRFEVVVGARPSPPS